MQEQMRLVLEQAARLQKLVPDAILVGGSAASIYAGHRHSRRFELILEDLEREGDWVTNKQLMETEPKDKSNIELFGLCGF